ncbi:MFS general substrate transporter [Agrocybe pediades]|nr:MFS general substrate transporter [Agrocybe pediades]
MAFGILEDEHLDSVPGTSLLSDYRPQTKIGHAASLKRGIGNQSHIILVPQPTDDPNEPLNWPKWKKEACFWTLSFATTLCGALSPLVGAGYVLLSMQFHVSVDEVASSFGALLLGLGCFMIVQNVLAVKFGHMIVYLGSVFLMFISCVWCALSPSLASIRASRVFQGFGMSSLQCLVPATIEQIYFVHERGSRSVIWNFCLMAGITLGPLLYSYVIKNMSWQMGFWFITIPLGLAGLLVFFFVPETSYASHENHMSRPSTHSQKNSLEDVGSPVGASSQSHEAPCPPIKSYASQLKIWNGTFNDAGITTLFFRPFPLLLSPITWFIFVSYCMQTVWLSLMPICSSTIFTIEYNFNATQIGLTNLGGIVGIVLATFISGPLTDWGTVWMSKHNKGVYEPEFRIVFMSTMLFGVFGYAGWAVGTTQNMHWIGAVALWSTSAW